MTPWEKILELQFKSPRMGITNLTSTNSDYTAYCAYNKNCYLLIGSEKNEDCMYGNWVYESKDCTDTGFTYNSELCYECVDIDKCYNCSFCQDCTNCTDCQYCYDCRASQNCFGCVGLRNKQYHILNKPVPKEKYQEEVERLKKDPTFTQQFENLKYTTPRLYSHVMDIENSVGDYLYNSKNSFSCFDGRKLEDCLYMSSSIEANDCMDMNNTYFGTQLSYESMSSIELYNSNYSNFCYHSRDLEYCEYLFNCQDCFGCFFLQKKQYYIFNEPYTKEDYFKKVSEIKAQMKNDGCYGKHLPSTIPLHDSAVENYFPSKKQ